MQVSINDVFSMLAEVFEEAQESITLNRELDSIEGWDSVGVLTLMAELDDQYSVTLTTDEIQNFTNISDIVNLLKEKNVDITD